MENRVGIVCAAKTARIWGTVVVFVAMLMGSVAALGQSADKIYVGANIVTMNEAQPSAEAVAVKDGKILAVGSRAELEGKFKGSATKIEELGNKALLPGFLDAHSHYISSLSVANQVQVYPPPSGPGKDVPSIAAGGNIIDVVAYPFITDLDKALASSPVNTWGSYDKHFKIGGVKITSDGSPQGRTAYFTTPYLLGGPGGETNWSGEPTFPEDTIKEMFKKVYALNVPLLVHANGDAAIDLVFRAHEYAAADDVTKDRHVTVIHAQFTRPDQLDKYVKYKFTPSFYTLHTFYFASAHVANRGAKQAAYISPMRDAIDKGLRPTNHTDFVVAPLDQMFMLWSAVNRISREGAAVGADQRVTVMEGLKAMTINVAWQYQEQAMKGSLEPGKLADLVILDKNPLKVDPLQIKDIKIEETIKEGKTIYKRQ